ncbi:MAG: prepilin-type N-terminal cleavage/methylation domain-containing protein [Actinomycetota bacterium]
MGGGLPARRPSRAARGGFTLVELLMGMGISLAFAAGLYAFFFAGLDAANTDASQAQAQTGLRQTVELFTRDVRQAVSPDDGINGGIQSLTATSAVVYVDPNRDPTATVPRPLRVRYQLVGTQLLRDVARPVGAAPPYSYTAYSTPVVMAEPVRNAATPVFQAFTEQGVSLGTPVAQTRDIKTVRIRLIVGQRTGNSQTTTELSTDVTLRNTSKY